MPQVKIIGISTFDFNDKKTGKAIKGVSFHYTEKISDDKGRGFKGDKFTVQDAYLVKVLRNPIEAYLDKVVEASFNKYGSLESLEIVK
jgi:hypothetical protein